MRYLAAPESAIPGSRFLRTGLTLLICQQRIKNSFLGTIGFGG
jgi:hypothetical protein